MGILSITTIPTWHGKTGAALRWLVVGMMVAVLLEFGSPTFAMAQIYRGKVVDAETGQPLEGAVFVIVWNKKPALSMNGPQYFHSATEALTDAKGEFSVDGSPAVDWNPFTYITKNPSVAVYMPGYGPFPVGHVKETPQKEIEKAMTGTGAIIKLPKLKTQEEMRRFASPGILHISTGTPYEEIPNLIRLINVHRKIAGLSSQIGPPAR